MQDNNHPTKTTTSTENSQNTTSNPPKYVLEHTELLLHYQIRLIKQLHLSPITIQGIHFIKEEINKKHEQITQLYQQYYQNAK